MFGLVWDLSHSVVLYKKGDACIVIDSNIPLGAHPGSVIIGAEYHETYASLFQSFKNSDSKTGFTTCKLKQVGAVNPNQWELELAVSVEMRTKTFGACKLCALGTTCFIALYAPDDFCLAWERLLVHCKTPEGEASCIRFVLSTLRLMRTLKESNATPLLVCNNPQNPEIHETAATRSQLRRELRYRAHEHQME